MEQEFSVSVAWGRHQADPDEMKAMEQEFGVTAAQQASLISLLMHCRISCVCVVSMLVAT